jgi:hypothetical protein
MRPSILFSRTVPHRLRPKHNKTSRRFIPLALATVLIYASASAQWVQTNGPYGGDVRCFAVSGKNLFAGTLGIQAWDRDGGVFLSTNNGTCWTQVVAGLPKTGLHALAAIGTHIFAGSSDGVFLSTNNGGNWTKVSDCGNNQIYTLTVCPNEVGGTNLFAGTSSGVVYLSTDSGTIWTRANTPFLDLSCMVHIDSIFFAGTGSGVYTSTNRGISWTPANIGLTNSSVNALTVSGTNLFAGTADGVFVSTNNGTCWTMVDSGLTYTHIYALAASGTNLFAGTYGGVFLSTNGGTSWTAASTGLMNTYVQTFAMVPDGESGTILLAGTHGGGIFLTTNNGASWSQANTGLTNTCVNALAASGSKLFAGTTNLGVFLSTDAGTSWTAVNKGIPKDPSDTTLYASVNALAVSGTNVFAGTTRVGVFLSTNDGTSWTAVNAGLPKIHWDTTQYGWIQAFAVGEKNLFAGTEGFGVFLSTNNGTSWIAADSGLPDLNIHAFVVSDTNLFAGYCYMPWAKPVYLGGVCLSTNNGTKWDEVYSGAGVNALVSSPNGTVGKNLFAGFGRPALVEGGPNGGVCLSANGGASWTDASAGLTDAGVMALAAIGVHLFAGTSAGGVYLSTNTGAGWVEVNEGLTNLDVRSLATAPNGADGTNLYVGTWGGGIWKRPLSEMITSVPLPSLVHPAPFNLSQNYPNPFNPVTRIQYTVAGAGGSGLGTSKTGDGAWGMGSSVVSLIVYDLLGREVAVLVNEKKALGSYEVTFDGSNLASGVYFYRMTAGDFVQTRKILLIR